MKLGLFIAGPKGAGLLAELQDSADIAFVCSYPNASAKDLSFERIKSVCDKKNLPLVMRKAAELEPRPQAEVSFFAGWQFLAKDIDPSRSVVFHDSLLPKYRGFSPTVSALLNGETVIGVTALRPVEQADAGPILGQESISIAYPIKVKRVYELLQGAYGRLAKRLLADLPRGLKPVEQPPTGASYSLWRDDRDFEIDWNQPASQIRRLIDSVGEPYAGARTTYDGKCIRIHDAEEIADLHFENRCAGKLWSVAGTEAVVVCGTGLLRISAAEWIDGGGRVEFRALRRRLGRPS